MTMRTGSVAIGLVIFCAATAHAQPGSSSDTIRRLDLTVQVQPLATSPLSWLPPDPRPLGALTLMPATQRGEIVKFSLPVGQFAMRGVRAVATAQRRRAERNARDRVRRELEIFIGSAPTPRVVP